MKKKLIASILCLAMVLAIVTPAVFANEEEGVKVPSEETGAPVAENTDAPVESKEPAKEEAPETEKPEESAPAVEGTEAPAEGEGEPKESEAPAEGTPVGEDTILPPSSETPAEETPAPETPVEGGGTTADGSTAGDAAHTEAPVEEPTEAPVDDPAETPAECTCGTEDGTHAEDCPLYNAEEAVEEKPEGTLPAWVEPYTSIRGARCFKKVAPLMNMQSLMTLDDYERSTDNGDVVLDKKAVANTDGSYTITLEAYATGASHTETHYDPADIVLVLDTSGSMNDAMSDEDFEPVYISSSDSIGTNETRYILQDGKYIKVYYTGSRWAIPSNGKYGNEVIPKSNANDTTTNYVRVFDDIDISKTYYVQFTKNNQITYQAVTYQTTGERNGWYTAAGKQQTPRTDSSSSEGNIFYQQQQNTQFYNLKATGSRLYHLKSSVNSFIDSVLTTSSESSIAIVNFGSVANTAEGFTSDDTTLKNAVNGLTANGATRADLGLSKATSLLDNLDDTHKDHKKVVIMFTDGVPTSNSDFETDVANSAIGTANSIKSGATVYTIGVFDGADGALSSFTESDVNKYMHLVSSNYPNAESMTNTGSVNSELNDKSYYLSAGSSAELMNIFQLISQEVGGATNTTLGTETVVKDIIAPSFTVPENTSNVKIYTANCTGAGLTFGDRTEVTSGITTTIDNDTLNVTGFDFSANWCGDHSGTYGGKKLIIEFTVSPKTGFLGGNGVPTNGANSGMYSDGKCVGSFEVPTVNVPIGNVTITASDKNVYLTQVPTDAQLKYGVTVKCGDVDITDPSKLDDWQKAYVDITVSGPTLSAGFNATEDGSYSVTASVKPKAGGDSSKPGTVTTEKTDEETKNINVFKPELTFKDGEAYYGDDEPTYTDKLTKTEWKYGETLSTAVIMVGDAPTLTPEYTAEEGKIVSGKVETKEDYAVNVTVKIGDKDVDSSNITFQHTDCKDKTCGTPENGKFWIHVKTCELTITKALTDDAYDDNDAFVFTVKSDKLGNDLKVVIKGAGSVTIKDLKVGDYTVTEDAGTNKWSWRYTTSSNPDDGKVTLSKDTSTGTVTFTNKAQDKWLGSSAYAKNEWKNGTLTGTGYIKPEEENK